MYSRSSPLFVEPLYDIIPHAMLGVLYMNFNLSHASSYFVTKAAMCSRKGVQATVISHSLLLPFIPSVANSSRSECSGILWKHASKLDEIVVPLGTTCQWIWGDDLAHCVDGRSCWNGLRLSTPLDFNSVSGYVSPVEMVENSPQLIQVTF